MKCKNTLGHLFHTEEVKRFAFRILVQKGSTATSTITIHKSMVSVSQKDRLKVFPCDAFA